jgi:hypothetical protein
LIQTEWFGYSECLASTELVWFDIDSAFGQSFKTYFAIVEFWIVSQI